MICEKCKIREATIQYTDFSSGVPETHHYCLQCASENLPNMERYSQILDGEFPLAKLLSGLLTARIGQTEDENYKNIECPTCHTTYEEFIKNSKFGCPDCYEVFDLLIGENIKQLQGSDTHKGKIPKNTSANVAAKVGNLDLNLDTHEDTDKIAKLNVLKRDLKKAIAEEEYEQAAKIRDEIKALENVDGGSES